MKKLLICLLLTTSAFANCDLSLDYEGNFGADYYESKNYSKLIKKKLRKKGYSFSEQGTSFNISFEPLQGTSSFGTSSVGVLIESSILEKEILVEGFTYRGLKSKRGLIKAAIRKVPSC